jgi:hypothetical protein
MAKRLNISDEERAEAQRNIENFFAFTQDVLADPTILDQIPDGAHVDAIPVAEREPGQHYDIETPNMVVIVTPPAAATSPEAISRQARKNGTNES